MQFQFNGKVIEVVQGDISAQKDIAAVVNATNARLETGGGVAGALHRAAGPELAEAGRKFAPIEPGEAVITPAFALPNDAVIHCLGPVYGQDKPEAELLESCYVRALELAQAEHLPSMAFPAISTGVFGYPPEEAMKTAVNTVLKELPHMTQVEKVRFVLFSEQERDLYNAYVKQKIG